VVRAGPRAAADPRYGPDRPGAAGDVPRRVRRGAASPDRAVLAPDCLHHLEAELDLTLRPGGVHRQADPVNESPGRFGTTKTGSVQSTQLVPAVTLDWLADRCTPSDVTKIDVEQAEVGILAGGSRVLGPPPRSSARWLPTTPRPEGTYSPGTASPCTAVTYF